MIKTVVVASIWTLILLATVVVSEVENSTPAAKQVSSTEKVSGNELIQSLPSDLSRVEQTSGTAEDSNRNKLQTSSAPVNQQQEIVGASSDLFSALTDGPMTVHNYETVPHFSHAQKSHFLQNMPLTGHLRRIDEINQALEASQSMNRKFNRPTNFLRPAQGPRAAPQQFNNNYNTANDRFFQDEPSHLGGSASPSGDPFVNARLAKRAGSSTVASQRGKSGATSTGPLAKASSDNQLDSVDYSDNSGELERQVNAAVDDIFKDDQRESLVEKADQRQAQKAQARSEEATESLDDYEGDGVSGGDDGSEGAASELQVSPDEQQASRPLRGIEDSTGVVENERQLEQSSSLKPKKSKSEVELYLHDDVNSGKGGAEKVAATDLQVAAGHHHKHHHGHYYQYAEVPKKKAWKMGFKRGNHKHTISRHEKGYKNKFHSSFKWNAKEKCKSKGKCHSVGKMSWHYEHHDKKKKHHY